MQIKRLGPHDPLLQQVERINDEAFPPEERMPVGEMFTFPIPTELLGLFTEAGLVGFSLILRSESVAMIVLLAIDGRFRGQGCGSQALRLLRKADPDRQLILDFEAVRAEAANYGQRVRRKQFYLRNGFHETGRFTTLCGEEYEVVCTGGPLREQPLAEILHAIHQYTPDFDEALGRFPAP